MINEIKITKLWDAKNKNPFFDIRLNGIGTTINFRQFVDLCKNVKNIDVSSPPEIGENTRWSIADEAFIEKWEKGAK